MKKALCLLALVGAAAHAANGPIITPTKPSTAVTVTAGVGLTGGGTGTSLTLNLSTNTVSANNFSSSYSSATYHDIIGMNNWRFWTAGDGSLLLYDLTYAPGGSILQVLPDNSFIIIQRPVQIGHTLQVSDTTTLADTTATSIQVSTLTFTGGGAPANSQALCLLGGQLGHCTGVVGVGGGCTCVAP